MFKNCQSLTTCTNINLGVVKTVNDNCYAGMFEGCKKLVTAPTTIQLQSAGAKTQYCLNMFKDCVSLINAPELPAIKLASNCYENMFRNCTSLTETPEFPATTLAN